MTLTLTQEDQELSAGERALVQQIRDMADAIREIAKDSTQHRYAAEQVEPAVPLVRLLAGIAEDQAQERAAALTEAGCRYWRQINACRSLADLTACDVAWAALQELALTAARDYHRAALTALRTGGELRCA